MILLAFFLYLFFRYIVSRQGKRPDEKGSVYHKGERRELSSSADETTSLSAVGSIGPTGDEVCDRYEEVDTTEGFVVTGSTKRPRQDSESMELSTMGDSRYSGRPTKRKFEPTRIAESIVEKIEEMLETYVYSPPQTITNSIYWVQDPKCKFISATSPEFMLAMNNWQTKLSHWTYEEFQTFYKAQRHYVWRRGVNYHSVRDSFKYAKQWLEEQCAVGSLCVYQNFGYQHVPIEPRELLQKISNVVNRREKKRFGIVFQGPNSCGKTWFTNMFLDFYINKGELQNWNRYQNKDFPFMGLVNRRIALWNEGRLNGDDMQLEDLKVLLEGESKTVGVKHQRDGTVIATPFIITTNNLMFEKNFAFKDRLTIINIDKIPMLTGGPSCPGKLHIHPFAFPLLINHYNIETNEIATIAGIEEITSLTNYMNFDDECIEIQ